MRYFSPEFAKYSGKIQLILIETSRDLAVLKKIPKIRRTAGIFPNPSIWDQTEKHQALFKRYIQNV